MQARVLIIQTRMPDYRVQLFERLRHKLAAAGVRLNVIYGPPSKRTAMRADSGVLLWGVQVACHYLRAPDVRAVYQKLPTALIDRQDLLILPHENGMLSNYPLLARLYFRRTPRLAFFGHGANFQAQDHHGLRERFKAWSCGLPDWWFAYTRASVERIEKNGFPPERITCLDNASDTREIEQWRESITEDEILSLRKRLGIVGRCVGVFIGSLNRHRKIPFLLAAAERLRELVPDFELLIIGDGLRRYWVEEFVARHEWCKWVGAKHGREKVLHMALGQVVLNPGMVGLNVLDAFATRLPMVTTDCGIHSPEVAYLEPEKNGLMTANEIDAFAAGVSRIFTDDSLRARLAQGCAESASRYTLDRMVEHFCAGIVSALEAVPEQSRQTRTALPEWHIAVIWQRFLPYHVARIRRLRERCEAMGYRLTAIEVAATDANYEGFAPVQTGAGLERVCCFRGMSYHDLSSRQIHTKVLEALDAAQPDFVLAPATPFPEGMAAVAYRERSGSRLVMMDDAWEHTDKRGSLVRSIKRLIHANIDGVFVPALSHTAYYHSLGFSTDRMVYGVDVVDNDYFASRADAARADAERVRGALGLPQRYFLFVGRFLPRKGLEMLIAAYEQYQRRCDGAPWNLVLVGSGSHLESIRKAFSNVAGLQFLGPQFGDDLCHCYGLANVLIVPSTLDPWGLVVNEGLASGLPVIVSTGCGAAHTLVAEGENGWCFAPGDVEGLTGLMLRASSCSADALAQMGRKSREIISEWSLDRFADGVFSAMQFPRAASGGFLADIAARLWKGRVSIN